MKKLLLLSALCFACASTRSPYPNVTVQDSKEMCYTIKYRIKVYCSGLNIKREDIETAADIFIQSVSTWLDLSLDKVQGALKGSTLEFTALPIRVNDVTGTMDARGAVLAGHVYVLYQTTLANSALYHEWMHLLISNITDEDDPRHQNFYWWILVPQIQDKAREAGL